MSEKFNKKLNFRKNNASITNETDETRNENVIRILFSYLSCVQRECFPECPDAEVQLIEFNWLVVFISCFMIK